MQEKEYSVQIRDLSVQFSTTDGVVHAINGIDLDIEKGKTLGLVGETGAGKTTTALSILRLIPDPPERSPEAPSFWMEKTSLSTPFRRWRISAVTMCL